MRPIPGLRQHGGLSARHRARGTEPVVAPSQWAAGHRRVTVGTVVSSRITAVLCQLCDTATRGTKEAVGQWVLQLGGVSGAGMSSRMAVAAERQPKSKGWTKTGFWGGTEHPFMMPSITAEGTGIRSCRRNIVLTNGCGLAWASLGAAAAPGVSPLWRVTPRRVCGRARACWVLEGGEPADAERDLVFLGFPEQMAVWDAVADYIQEQLLLHEVGQDPRCPRPPRWVGSPHGPGHGLLALFPSSQSRKFTPNVPTDGQTGLVQGWWHLWYWHLWYCTAGLVPVAGDPLDAVGMLHCDSTMVFFGGVGTWHLLSKAILTAPAHGSAQQEQAGSNPKHHPWAGPPPASPHLSLPLQGVRIPTLGSFDAVPKQIQVGDEAVTIPIPVFHLARNLAVVHNLTDNKAYLPGKTAG